MGKLNKIKLVGAILVLIAVFVLGLRFSGLKTSPLLSINTNRASIITEMRNLERLETASFTIEKIVDGGTVDANVFQKFLFGDRILLIAHGQVIAGFDFSELKDSDLVITNENIHITLPKPKILVTSLDNTQTKVYDRQKGILNPGIKDLESAARFEAEKSIKEAACTGGILNQASENGRKQITALLYALGFKQVFLDIPLGSCSN
jgi:hypothetical protein